MTGFSLPHPDAAARVNPGDFSVLDAPCGPVIAVPHPRHPEVVCFHGIPYASPPTGALFLEPPQPHPRWDQPRRCDRLGPTPQRRPYTRSSLLDEPSISAEPGQSILNLSVTVSAGVLGTAGSAGSQARGSRRAAPVLVWIHGGGFKSGVAESPICDPWRFAEAGVVCVSISYRLGFEGFGWVPGLTSNLGLRDQQLALRWVRDNIAAFGGDPQRVCIAGHSAGGGSVLAHLTSPPSQGLFHRAISVSGVIPTLTANQAAQRGQIFLAELGRQLGYDRPIIPTQLRGLAPDPAWVEAEFAAEEQIFAPGEDPVEFVAQRLQRRPMSDLPFMPFVDGKVLPNAVEDELLNGVGAKTPLLITYTSEEFTDICSPLRGFFAGFDTEDLLRRAGLEGAAQYADRHRELPTHLVVGQLISDVFFPELASQLSHARLRHGGHTEVREFDWCPARQSDRPVSPMQRYARHGMDLPFAFDTVDTDSARLLVGPHPDRELVEQTHHWWLDFIAAD